MKRNHLRITWPTVRHLVIRWLIVLVIFIVSILLYKPLPSEAFIIKLVFITSSQTISAGQASAVITVQTQTPASAPENVTSDITILLSSNSTAGRFDTNPSGDFDGTITSVIIPNGQNSASFYYKDTNAGQPKITADENPSRGWAAATQTETITAAVTVSISNTPSTYDLGTVNATATYDTGLSYFTVTNNGTATVNITISSSNMTGGVPWVLSDTATQGADQYGLKTGLSGGDYTITVTGSGNTLISGLAASANQSWGFRFFAPSSFSDATSKSGTITLTATQD